MGKVNCVWPFLYSGPPTYLHLPELYNEGDRAPPNTATHPHAHGHQCTRIPRAFTAFEQKATAPQSAFHAFQPSLLFAAFHLSPEAPGERRPWGEELDGSVLSGVCVARAIPSSSPGTQRQWSLESSYPNIL